MQELQDRVKNTGNRHRPEPSSAASNGQSESKVLLKYPSLERLFEGDNSDALSDMRARLERTRQGMDRVIRQGPQTDVARASRIAEAYDLALGLLRELESAASGKS